MLPFEVLNVNPVGNTGDIENVILPYPPLAETGVVDVIANCFTNDRLLKSRVVVKAAGADTVILVSLLRCVLCASVAVIVYVVVSLVTEDVPLIRPVVVLKLNPLGREGLILNVYGGYPYAAVTGVNSVIARYCIRLLVAIAIVVVNAGGRIVTVTSLLLVCFA